MNDDMLSNMLDVERSTFERELEGGYLNQGQAAYPCLNT